MMRRFRFCREGLAALISVLLLGGAVTAGAAGPARIAKAEPQLWGERIDSKAAFDKASRASILTYLLALRDMEKLGDSDMRTAFKIKSVNRRSVEKWIAQELWHVLDNYRAAADSCEAGDWTCVNEPESVQALLSEAGAWRADIPESHRAWYDNANGFAHAYLAEQLRLAALFPKVSSEIDRFNELEWNGDELPDRRFFLSFDDGPSAASGNSDATIAMLTKQGKNGVFFVLGENLKKRAGGEKARNLASLYQEQCVASHGWEHQSHAKWGEWQHSVKNTQALLHESVTDRQLLPLFRPPYGQRKADSGAFFKAHGLHVALWNLDSQDWNSRVTPDDIQKRMIALMLIKRHGVLLFHDVHPKAKTALPALFKALGDAVEWGDCQALRSL